MKKKIKKIPPRDSWIALPPGKSTTINAKFMKYWNEQTRIFREVRGNVLAHAFNIEYTLDQIISRTFLGSKEKNTDDKLNLFDEIILKSAGLTFKKKIDILNRLHSTIPLISKKLSKDFFKKIDKVRDIRNRFAHYPIVFDCPDGKKQKLKAKLCCRDKTIILTRKTLDDFGEILGIVIKQLEDLLKEFENNKSITRQSS